MDAPSGAIDHQELLAQMGWVESLALSLVRDPNVARDVAQDAWVVALERPPRATSGPGLRAWLATVTRTLARQSVRSSRRRTAREERAARGEAEPSTSDVVQRGEMQKCLAAAVMDLDEPYRSTILMRYLDGHGAPVIAERMGVSPAAVRKRIERGLGQLRGRLDSEHGGNRGAWMAALLPLARRAETRVAAVGMGTLVGLAAVVLVAVGVAVSLGGDETGVVAPGLAPGAGEVALPSPPATTLPTGLPGLARPLAVGGGLPRTEALDLPAAVVPPSRWIAGRVLDAAGRPAQGLRVRFEPAVSSRVTGREAATVTALADDRGAFELRASTDRGRLLAASSRHVTLLAGHVAPEARLDQTIVVAEAREVSGLVLGDDGLPRADARVRLELPEGFTARVDAALARAELQVFETTTDGAGRFRLARAPVVEGAALVARAPGWEPARASPGPLGVEARLVLTRPAAVLEGLVVDQGGVPVADARVSDGIEQTRTGDDGRFTLYQPSEALRLVPERRLVAFAPGHQPALLEPLTGGAGQHPGESGAPASGLSGTGDPGTGDPGTGDPGTGDPGTGGQGTGAVGGAEGAQGALDADVAPTATPPRWPSPLVLRLGPPPGAVSGRVMDESGAPVEGVGVWLADPTPFVCEALPEDVGHVETTGIENAVALSWRTVETQLAGVEERPWHVVPTDAEGRFRIEGLADRPYTVVAMNTWTLARVELPVDPREGGDVELVLDRHQTLPRLAGRVETRRGLPVPGVKVQVRTPAFHLGGTTWIEVGATDLTDADGRFTLAGVSRRGVVLRVVGEGVVPTDLPHGQTDMKAGAELPSLVEALGGDPGNVRLVVPLRASFQVALDDPGEADGATMLDDRGEPLELNVFSHGRRRIEPRLELVDGRSEVFTTTDAAAWLVLRRGDDEVRRLAVAPVAGEVVTLR